MNTILVANQKGGCGKSSVAITLASALANQNTNQSIKVALADADPQKSSLRWLKYRPETAKKIFAVDWRKDEDIGNLPKKVAKKIGDDGWLVIDAPGSLSPDTASSLIAEANAVIIPVLPSIFDIDSTKKFLKSIQDIKRVRKGKVAIHLLANRINTSTTNTARLQQFFDDIGQYPLAWIGERSVYAILAEHGLALFDQNQKSFCEVQKQWQPVLESLVPSIAMGYAEQVADISLSETLTKLNQASKIANNAHHKSSVSSHTGSNVNIGAGNTSSTQEILLSTSVHKQTANKKSQTWYE